MAIKFRNINIISISGLIFFILIACQSKKPGNLIHMENFQSKYIEPRNVDIWLPSDYRLDENKRFPVLYMHDGQNLFDSTIAYGGMTWGVDQWISKLSKERKIRQAIVVGIWNTPKRFREYMPQKPFQYLSQEIQEKLVDEYGGMPLSDAYLRFIVEELKPFIDNTYRTLPGPENTFMMGSSMGGLISAYALCEYPEIFSGSACLSTHWPLSLEFNSPETSDAYVRYFTENLPLPDNHKIYFDYGTETLDAMYEPHQLKIDSVFLRYGYQPGNNFISKKFEGAEHNEYYWNKRLQSPLEFLLRAKK